MRVLYRQALGWSIYSLKIEDVPLFIQPSISNYRRYILADTRRWPYVGSLLARRLRRRPNSAPTLGRRLVHVGWVYLTDIMRWCVVLIYLQRSRLMGSKCVWWAVSNQKVNINQWVNINCDTLITSSLWNWKRVNHPPLCKVGSNSLNYIGT